MAIKIQTRRGAAAEWAVANPVLAEGEAGLETDTGNVKYGDGVRPWAELPYTTLVPGPDEVIIGSADGPVARDVSEIGGGSVGTFSANTFGADPDATWETNRDAFQAANDAAFAAGGGRVTAAPGTYLVKGIEQDSRVTFDLPGVVLRSPDGQAPGVIESRLRATTGTVTGATVTVADAAGIEVGSLVGIQAAGGVHYGQNTLLTVAIDATQTTGITLATRGGFPSSGFLVIGTEVIAYTGFSTATLTGVTRGAFGTTAAAHTTSEPIGMAIRHYAIVTDMAGTTLTLDTPAVLDVSGVAVTSGPVGAAIRPGLTVDGNAPATGAASSVHAVSLSLARHCRVDGLTVINGDQGGFTLSRGARDNRITDLTLHNCGIPDVGKGAALWLYQACTRNHLTGITVTGKTWVAVYLDDRTTTAAEWDGLVDANMLTALTLDLAAPATGYPAAINVVGGNYNKIIGGTLRGVNTGFAFSAGQQSTTWDGAHPPATGNEAASLYMEPRAAAWVTDYPGNYIHDVDWTDALGNPITHAGTTVYDTKLVNGGGIESNARFGNGSAGAPAIALQSDPDTGFFRYGEDIWGWSAGGTTRILMYGTQFKLQDGTHLEFGTGAGSRIGFSPTRKFAFWGGTPTTQPEAIPDTTGGDVAALEAEVNKLKALLRSIGLMAS